MTGFIKGIVVGVISFVLGFAVLSLAVPVEAPEAGNTPEPAQVAEAPAPEAPAAQQPEAPVDEEPEGVSLSASEGDVSPVEPEAVADEIAPVQGEALPDSVELVGEPSPGTVAETETPVEGDPVAPETTGETAAAPATVAADEPAAPEVSAVPATPASENVAPDEAAPEAPAMVEGEADALPSEAAEDAVVGITDETEGTTETPVVEISAVDAEASESATNSEVVPDDEPTEYSAEQPVPTDAAATDATPDVNASDLGVPEEAPSVGAEVASAVDDGAPVAERAADVQEPEAEAPEPAPAEETLGEDPAPGTVPSDTTPREPADDLAPVAAESTPDNEPLLGDETPATGLPRVREMPSGTPDVTVRRPGAGDPAVRRLGSGGGRLPTVGETIVVSPDATDGAAPEADPNAPAILRNAATPDMQPDQRPLGVVLIDSAEAETGVLALPVPVTIALDPFDSDAPRRARAYRAAGHEIALRAARLPALASDSDIALTLDFWQREFPQTALFVDVPINGLGANAPLARDFAGMIAPYGYGAVSLRNGLDAFLQAARANGLPATSVYRALDDEDQGEFTIRRLIDRAAFEALRQDGIVVMGDAANRATMTELADFAAGSGRAGVALTPVSTTLIAPQ
ncbi:divergent polysaccharide deacetylase family protein [Rhodobacter sp. NTK016B]|uniref:divergent polysaccharide deacetylase family protein n=1 Tax=Rhodobacter sp. NTK016B TaxID=2759676 RepID=UPI001A8F8917|nr:divergent polysaccharide deacetylase family protein [Rhodobacter sp. NTK016B]MBN8292389.1 divergent polysaccharide deacetylase family protein [Rhodobacter sp. NTK016B]